MEQYSPNDLLIFAHVAQAGSFSRAAERIGLPKSTVSRRIAVLEDALGERLILRTTRRLRLTEFGQEMLEYARQVVAGVDAVKALSEHRQVRPSGALRVSMPSDFAQILLTEMLAAFAALHPAISLELDLSPRHVDLLGENFDLAVRTGALPDDSLLAARRLAQLPWGLYAGPAYLADRGEPQTPEALTRHECLTLLGRDREPIPWVLWRGKERYERAPGRLAGNSPELIMSLASAGAGIAAVPVCFAAPHVRAGRLRRVLSAWAPPPSTAWAVFPGRRLMPAKTRAFIDMLEAVFSRMDADAAGVSVGVP